MAGRLLLKSPNHTFRIRALLKEFPGAAYVWLVRDPAEAFFSNRKMWISLFQRYALWDWEISALDRFLARAFCSAANCLTHAVGNVAKERLVVVDFDRLTHSPVDCLEAANHRLSLGTWGKMGGAVAQAAAAKAGAKDLTVPVAIVILSE